MTPVPWPELPTAAWRETYATLHLWTQIAGKIRLARSPWLNHSWHVALYVTARGLTTSPIPDGVRTFQIDFDFIDHHVRISTSDGAQKQFALAGQSVASFYAAVIASLAELGIHIAIDEIPNELPDPIRFSADLSTPLTIRTRCGAFFRFWSMPIGCSSNSEPDFSARPARCIFSGAASILRSRAFRDARHRSILAAFLTCLTGWRAKLIRTK